MPKRSKAPAGLYTAGEAIKRLGMPTTTFHSYVRDGRIKKIAPPGRSEGYYEKAAIDKMARVNESFALQYAAEPAIFSVATPEDVPGIYEVSASLWGTLHATPIETRLKWYEVNPAIDYVVKQEGIVTGYFTFRPMKREILEKLTRAEIRGRNIEPADILPFTPGIPLECYAGIAVKAGIYKPEKYGMRLLMGALETLNKFARQGIFIKKFYGVSDTPAGVQLGHDLGFTEEMPASASLSRQFTLDTAETNSPFIQKYIKVLKQTLKDELA